MIPSEPFATLLRMSRSHAPTSADNDAADRRPDGDERPSKTAAASKQSHELQALGEALAELPDARLAATRDCPSGCATPCSSTSAPARHEGRRRQLQYIGKLMREADDAPLREAVAEAQARLGAATRWRCTEAERWRDELLADDEALTRWIARASRTPTRSTCAAWCAQRAQGRRAAARAAQRRAASASCSSSSSPLLVGACRMS